jgi:hypothetical protein
MAQLQAGFIFEITHHIEGQLPVMIIDQADTVSVYLRGHKTPVRVTGDAVERNEEGEVARVNMRLSASGKLTWFQCVKVGRSI